MKRQRRIASRGDTTSGRCSSTVPELTDALKAKILGLNAAALYGVDPDAMRCAIDEDELTRLTMSWPLPRPTFRQYGPRSRRELLAFFAGRGDKPG